MTYMGDPGWWMRQTETYQLAEKGGFATTIPELGWWERNAQTETRPAWGKFWPEDYIDKDILIIDCPVYCWIAMGMSFKTPIDDVIKITIWLHENIDNIWEGPIGYMGVWKFRFTDESDAMAFKLVK